MPDHSPVDDAPKRLNMLSDRERAALIAESLTEITAVPCDVTIRAVSYAGYLARRGRYRSPDRLSFSVAAANDDRAPDELTEELQSYPAPRFATAVADALGKRCGESYSAMVAEKRFAAGRRKSDIANYTVLIALAPPAS